MTLGHDPELREFDFPLKMPRAVRCGQREGIGEERSPEAAFAFGGLFGDDELTRKDALFVEYHLLPFPPLCAALGRHNNVPLVEVAHDVSDSGTHEGRFRTAATVAGEEGADAAKVAECDGVTDP